MDSFFKNHPRLSLSVTTGLVHLDVFDEEFFLNPGELFRGSALDFSAGGQAYASHARAYIGFVLPEFASSGVTAALSAILAAFLAAVWTPFQTSIWLFASNSH